MKNLVRFAIGALLLASAAAYAAVTPNSFVTPQTPTIGLQIFLQGTDVAGTYKTLYTGGANGSRCYSISLSNNDASATHVMNVRFASGATQYGGAALKTALSAGFTDANPPQNVIEAFGGTLAKDAYGNQYIQLGSGQIIQATFATAMSASTGIWFYLTCADF